MHTNTAKTNLADTESATATRSSRKSLLAGVLEVSHETPSAPADVVNVTADGKMGLTADGKIRVLKTNKGRPKPLNLAQYSDSEDEEMPNRIGNVPLHWYDEEDHIGYDIYGNKIIRKDRGDNIDAFLARTDDPNAGRTVYDKLNDEKIVLTDEELAIINRIRKGMFPDKHFDPYDDEILTRVEPYQGILANPIPPKARFIPSKWEAMKIVKFIHRLRNGWIRDPNLPPKPKKTEKMYDLWANSKEVPHLNLLPPPKLRLPGHAESFNPPEEFLWTEKEKKYQLSLPPNKRQYNFIPTKYNSLREIEAYPNLVVENHERCLDLYMAVRGEQKRKQGPTVRQRFDQLPKPKDLRPFPTTFSIEYIGHKGIVRSIDVSPTGQWLVSGSEDGTVRLWEVSTARCVRIWNLQEKIVSVAWNPNPSLPLVAAGMDSGCVILHTGTGTTEEGEHVEQLLRTAHARNRRAVRDSYMQRRSAAQSAKASAAVQAKLDKRVRWLSWRHRLMLLESPERFMEEQQKEDEEDMRLAEQDLDAYLESKRMDEEAELHNEYVDGDLQDDNVKGLARLFIYMHNGASDVSWHRKGDYLATVSPTNSGGTVVIHRLSLAGSQYPFRNTKGQLQCARFHPILPHFYVVTQQFVYIYNLAEHKRIKTLRGASTYNAAMAIHPRGEHVIVGGYDSRAAWFDTELSETPFRSMRYHRKAVRSVAFHPKFPLFATASDDGFLHILHCTVYNDFLTDPLIVPLKIIHAHIPKDDFGIMQTVFHPVQPWVFTCAADHSIRMFS